MNTWQGEGRWKVVAVIGGITAAQHVHGCRCGADQLGGSEGPIEHSAKMVLELRGHPRLNGGETRNCVVPPPVR